MGRLWDDTQNNLSVRLRLKALKRESMPADIAMVVGAIAALKPTFDALRSARAAKAVYTHTPC